MNNGLIFGISAIVLILGLALGGAGDLRMGSLAVQITLPLAIAFALVAVLSKTTGRCAQFDSVIPYALFFSITFATAAGLAEPLSGAYLGELNLAVYGLSFYSACVAFWVQTGRKSPAQPFVFANPLLLFSGPIAYRTFKVSAPFLKRMSYYGPFIIIGIFFFKTIASPMTFFLSRNALTDGFSVLTYAVIFEMFIYFNFAGLSLIVFGVLGTIGLRVPLNFRQPFSSRNLVEFWRGWHVSLSAVLKQLFYLPVRRVLGPYVAVLIVFLSSALWHGLAGNMVIWGCIHASFYVLTILLLKRATPLLPLVFMVVAVVLGRLIFAESNWGILIEKLSFKFDGADLGFLTAAPKSAQIAIFMGVFLIAIEFALQKNFVVAKRTYRHLRNWLPLSVIVILVALLTEGSGLDFAAYGQR